MLLMHALKMEGIVAKSTWVVKGDNNALNLYFCLLLSLLIQGLALYNIYLHI